MPPTTWIVYQLPATTLPEPVWMPVAQRATKSSVLNTDVCGHVPPTLSCWSWAWAFAPSESIEIEIGPDAVAWKRYESTSREFIMPRAVPRMTVPEADGIGMSVKRFGVEPQPSLVAVP